MPRDEAGSPPGSPHSGYPAAGPLALLMGRLNRGVGDEYEVMRLLGGGGMGFVFLARERTLDRIVAIKALRPELATEAAVARFLREARILARIRHPNIIPVHRAGTADGLPYYVMDYVEGETLADRLRRGPLSEREAIAAGRALLDALAAAHAEGVVHRDVKPANIFLAGGRVLLGDFGVARMDTTDPEATSTSGMVGTPAYMAPEQAAGGGVTEQVDLYAAGMVIYEMLTGRRWVPVADPAQADWTGVPRRHRAALRRALAWHPERRWGRAAAFRRVLSPRYRVLSRVTVSGWVVALTVVIGTVAWMWWLQRDPLRPPLDLAILPFEVKPPDESDLGAEMAVLVRHGVGVPQLRTSSEAIAIRGPAGLVWARSRGPEACRRLGAALCTDGWIRRGGDTLEVGLSLLDESGLAVHEMPALGGGAGDLIPLSERTAAWLLRTLVPRLAGTHRSTSGLSNDPAAISLYLKGEFAFYRDAPEVAAEDYEAALALDSTFALARWRLLNVWRWQPSRTPDLRPHLEKLARAGPGRLGPLDSTLVRAMLLPAGDARLEAYREAARVWPHEPFPLMLWGEELFHRGPLAGHPFDTAAHVLEAAVQLDPLFAPAIELLAWLYIRTGREVDARRHLDSLDVIVGRGESGTPRYARWLQQAWAERFAAQGALAQRLQLLTGAGPDWFERLAFALRMPFAFDMPDLEAEFGRYAVEEVSGFASIHADGHYGIALADAVRGRGRRALAHLDSAATLARTDGAALHAAEWRVLPGAVGLPLFPDGERERGRAALERLAGIPATEVRAVWALALDAAARGDTAAAGRWRDRLARQAADSVAQRLQGIVAARAIAGRGEYGAALEASRAYLVHDAQQRHGDPFARSVLHLLRAAWYQELGDRERVERELRWAENLDIVGWPGGEPQAAEIDWMLSAHASFLRGLNALDARDRGTGCAQLERAIALWSAPDPEHRPRLDEAVRRRAEACS